MSRCRYIKVSEYERLKLWQFGNFNAGGSIKGMKKKHYGKDALLVKCGSYIYNVTSKPEIYWKEAY